MKQETTKKDNVNIEKLEQLKLVTPLELETLLKEKKLTLEEQGELLSRFVIEKEVNLIKRSDIIQDNINGNNANNSDLSSPVVRTSQKSLWELRDRSLDLGKNIDMLNKSIKMNVSPQDYDSKGNKKEYIRLATESMEGGTWEYNNSHVERYRNTKKNNDHEINK